jgi:L-fuconolactonase
MLDAHQHFWKVDRGDYGWMTPDLKPLYRDFGPGDLSPHLEQAVVSRTVLVQAAETEAETDFLLEIAARTDFVAGVVGWVDPLADDFPVRLAHYS